MASKLNLNAILKDVLYYNGLDIVVRTWADLPSDSGIICCPENYNDDPPFPEEMAQLQIIWMIAVLKFGEYGTSPRFGWIVDVDGFRKWIPVIAPNHEDL